VTPRQGEELAISKTEVPDASMAPEQGQLVRVRSRLWRVSDTVPHEAGGDGMASTPRATLLTPHLRAASVRDPVHARL
jgi:hypothetical protein